MGENKINEWPEVKGIAKLDEKIKIAIQINGKTKQIIEVKKNLDEKSATNEACENKKINDILKNKKIIKIIFVKNKIINYLIE